VGQGFGVPVMSSRVQVCDMCRENVQLGVLVLVLVWVSVTNILVCVTNLPPSRNAPYCTYRQSSCQGLNRRMRCYRYSPGAVYRPHIDGAWPPSGETSEKREQAGAAARIMRGKGQGAQDAGQYIYDISHGKVLSKYTFLLYLNEDFTGGGTSFYSPCELEEGLLERRAVRPRAGSALVFPHGATNAALHEGSEVETGLKYVIRTEILFAV
jgi:hypothetical protein